MTPKNTCAKTSSPSKSFKTPELVIAGLTPDEIQGLKDIWLAEYVKDLDRVAACKSVGLKPRELTLLLRDDPEFTRQVENIKGADDALLVDKARAVLWDLLETGSEGIRAQLLKHIEGTRGGYGTKTTSEVTVREIDNCHPVGIDPTAFKLTHSESKEAVKPVPEITVVPAAKPHKVEFA